MSSETRAESAGTDSHWAQSLPYEWSTYTHEGEVIAVRAPPEHTVQAFRVVDETRCVRALAHADAVLYDGTLVEGEYESRYKTVDFYDDYGGRMASHSVDSWLKQPVPRLEALEGYNVE